MKKTLLALFCCISMIELMAQEETTKNNNRVKQLFYAKVRFTDRTMQKGWLFKVDDDSLYLLPEKMKAHKVKHYGKQKLANFQLGIGISEIDKIATKKHNLKRNGALIGLGVGAAIGTLRYVKAQKTDYGLCTFDLSGALPYGYGIIGATAGALIGSTFVTKFIIQGSKILYCTQYELLQKQSIFN